MRERSLTRAAQYVGMSQPAVSTALKRLRHLLNDELFVRAPSGVVPTPRSLELARPVRDALSQLQSALDPVNFVPATATTTFHVAASDHCAILVLPELYKRLRAQAPGIRLYVRPKCDHLLLSEMDAGEVHLALGIFGDLPNRIRHEPLFKDDLVCVMRRQHPLAGKTTTINAFFAADHLAIMHFGEATNLLDGLLAKKGLERNVILTVNQSLLAPLFLKDADIILTTFARLVSHTVAFDDFHVVPIPLMFGPIAVQLAWPDKLDRHPAHAWMHQQIHEVCLHIH